MKSELLEYNLPIKGLKDGIHQYRFDVNKKFFDQYEQSTVKNGKFDVQLEVDKRPSMIMLNFESIGEINVNCDRCLNEISIPVEANDEVLIKFSEEENMSEEIRILSPEESVLNVADMIFEMIHLNLPLINRKDCEADNYKDCNPKVLKVLEGYEVEDAEEENKGNDIWNELKNIKFN